MVNPARSSAHSINADVEDLDQTMAGGASIWQIDNTAANQTMLGDVTADQTMIISTKEGP